MTAAILPPDVLKEPGFQPFRYVSDPSQCIFYHSMDLPGFGLQTGHWDLRHNVDDYLGRQDFTGKRVIDVGTASGYLTFEMEKRGAEMVAFDRLLGTPLDRMGLVPFADFATRFGSTSAEAVQARVDSHLRVQNSFWLSHRLLGSKARLYCGDVNHCPPELGEFDIAFFGAILLHLRDPLQALTTFAAATRGKLIVTEPRENIGHLADMPVMFLRPHIGDPGNPGTWWYLTPALLKQFLEVLGFTSFETYDHEVTLTPATPVNCFTLIASR